MASRARSLLIASSLVIAVACARLGGRAHADSERRLPYQWQRVLGGQVRQDLTQRQDAAQLQAQVEGVLQGLHGTFAVAVENLTTGETILINSDQVLPAASLYKVGVLYEAYRQREAGQLPFDTTLTIDDDDMVEATDEDPLVADDRITVDKALELMIDVSSNAAAHALLKRIGIDRVNESLARLGMTRTHVPPAEAATSTQDWRATEASTSAGDMLAFFRALYRRTLVSPSASGAMLSLLERQEVNDRIPAQLPPGTVVAHKTGSLTGVVNDAGIMFGPRADVAIVLMANDADDGFATDGEARIAALVYGFYNPPTPRAWFPLPRGDRPF